MNIGPGIRVAMDVRSLAQDSLPARLNICRELFVRLNEPFQSKSFRCADNQISDIQELDEANVRLPQDFFVSADVVVSVWGRPPWPLLDGPLHAYFVFDLTHVPERGAAHDPFDELALVFVPSATLKRELLARRPDLGAPQIVVIPIAPSAAAKPVLAPERLAKARAKYGLAPTQRYLLGIAPRSGRQRFVDILLACLPLPACGDLTLVLFDHDRHGSSESDEAGLTVPTQWRHRVCLAGQLDGADSPALYSQAEFLLVPAGYYGIETTVLDALACGLPVVGRSNSLMRELSGEAGRLIDSDDDYAISLEIARILQTGRARVDLRSSALRQAKCSSWDDSAATMQQALLEKFQRNARHAKYQYPVTRAEQRQEHWMMREDGTEVASIDNYRNGAEGPRFPESARARFSELGGVVWPKWSDELLTEGRNAARIEGGRRKRGIFKQGTSDRPLISYVTVVRNNTETLARTIESVQRQTYDNVEHIVLDGASTDGTIELIQRYADRLDYFASEPDRGLYDALNKAIPLARGDFICVLNSDDWLEPSAAEIVAQRMGARRDAAILLSGAAVDVQGKVIEWYPAFIHGGCYFTCANDCHNAVYATPAAYAKTGPYDTSYKIAADFKWLMTGLDVGVRHVYTRELTVNYSLGGTSSDVLSHSLECCRVVAQRFPDLTSAEVHGLYHCFFALGVDKGALIPNQVTDSKLFLRKLAALHADDAEFMGALAWAMLEQKDEPVPQVAQSTFQSDSPLGIRSASKHLLRAVSRRYPALGRVVANSRALVKKAI